MLPVEPTALTREYRTRVDLTSFVFHASEGAFLLPLHPLKAGTNLQFRILSPHSELQPFHALISEDDSCLSFVTGLRPQVLGSSLLLVYPSWADSSRRRSLREDEVYTSFKYNGQVTAMSCLNKMTLITACHLSERLHDFLTMM
jgi:hypothetical protein